MFFAVVISHHNFFSRLVDVQCHVDRRTVHRTNTDDRTIIVFNDYPGMTEHGKTHPIKYDRVRRVQYVGLSTYIHEYSNLKLEEFIL